MPAQHVVAADNFLIPNATFFAELFAFAIILYFAAKYIVPPVQRMMREREEMIRQQGKDADQAREQLAEAQRAYKNALTEARTEAAQIREGARAEAQRVVEDVRTEAQAEQARIIARGDEQLEQQRSTIVRELRAEIGSLAVELSERIVGQQLATDSDVRATVDSFIAGLEAQDTADDVAAQAGSQ